MIEQNEKTKLFIEKAIVKHGDKYDYSKVEYIKSQEKVIIICKKHGEFQQISTNHIRGNGCNKCAIENNHNNKKSNTEEFIQTSKEIHGDKYDYSKVVYDKSNIKVIIICKKHGEFKQRPGNHLNGQGCKKCGQVYSPTTNEFIENAINIHGDKYDYSKVKYNKAIEKVIIICKEHGEFLQQPCSHLSGYGCKKCGIELSIEKRKINIEEIIEKAITLHGDKYNYSKVEFIKMHEKVIIICKKHGEYNQILSDHLSGHGCNKCGIEKNANNCTGYSKISIQYLDFISKYNNIYIQHAENVGEHIIKTTKFRADGFCEKTNTIYEFHGDFWHGNPNLYDTNDINKRNGKTFGELYQKTLEREQLIKELGYNLVIIWENDWNKLNKSIRTLQQKFKQHH